MPLFIGLKRQPNIVNRRTGRHFNKIYLLDEFQNKINRVRFEIEEIRYRYKKTLAEYLRERKNNAYKRRRRDLDKIQEIKPLKLCDYQDKNKLDGKVKNLKLRRIFKNEMEEIENTDDLVIDLHKYLLKQTNDHEKRYIEHNIKNEIIQKQKEHKIENMYNVRNKCDQNHKVDNKMDTKVAEAGKTKEKEYFNHATVDRKDLKTRRIQKLLLQNELNENVLAWLQNIRNDNEVKNNDIINTRKSKKRVKRFRTLSQMDTHELRESNDKILDSVSLQIPCEYCGLYFPSTQCLYDHVRTRHDAKFVRDYVKGKFTETDERELTKTEDPIKEIEEGRIDYKKLFNRRRKRAINMTGKFISEKSLMWPLNMDGIMLMFVIYTIQ